MSDSRHTCVVDVPPGLVCDIPCAACDTEVGAMSARFISDAMDRIAPSFFWSALTPAQALALLRSAPRIAMPWRDEPEAAYPNAMARRNVDGECVADVFRESKTAQPMWICSGVAHGDAPSLEEGRELADAALRAAGWLLVDDDAEGER